MSCQTFSVTFHIKSYKSYKFSPRFSQLSTLSQLTVSAFRALRGPLCGLLAFAFTCSQNAPKGPRGPRATRWYKMVQVISWNFLKSLKRSRDFDRCWMWYVSTFVIENTVRLAKFAQHQQHQARTVSPSVVLLSSFPAKCRTTKNGQHHLRGMSVCLFFKESLCHAAGTMRMAASRKTIGSSVLNHAKPK